MAHTLLVLEGIRQRLAPTDGIERHLLTVRLLGAVGSVLDVGGVPGLLSPHVSGASVTTINVDESADIVVAAGPHRFPVQDRSYEAVVSLDTLEHIPPADRPLFVSECLRVANRRVVLCCPLGNEIRRAIEAADNAFYRGLTGQDHPWISEHLEHGTPRQTELEALFAADGWRVDYRYSGDSRVTSHQLRLAETSNVRRRPQDVGRWVWWRITHRPDLELSLIPAPYTNRVFVLADRLPAVGDEPNY